VTRHPGHSRGIVLCALLSIPLGWGGEAFAGDLVVKPSLAVGEEYSDNIRETADGRKTEFTTRVRPGAVVGYRTSMLSIDGNYTFDYRNYARGTHGDELFHNLDFKGTGELIDNLAFLSVTEGLHRTTVNVARDVESESLLTEQTTQNALSVSPFLLWRDGDKGSIKGGYSYSETRYWEGPGINRHEHSGFAELTRQLSEQMTLYAAYTFTREDASRAGYDRHDVIAGFQYTYGDNSFIFGRAGNSWQRFSGGISSSNMLWDAGISHDFRIATALFETKVENTLDPLSLSTRQVSYTGRLDRPFARGAIGVSSTYAEYFITQTDKLEQRRLSITGTGRYDLKPRVSLSAAVTGDRFSRNSDRDYPFRLTASGGVNYGFFNDYTAVSLSYSYRLERKWFDSASGERAINRVLLELRTGL
jgi:hypothetical protein